MLGELGNALKMPRTIDCFLCFLSIPSHHGCSSPVSFCSFFTSRLMASSHSLFEETRISSAVTADSALKFYEEHGIFYQANPEIGRLRREIRGRTQREKLFDAIKPIVLKDPVSITSGVLRYY